MNTTESYFNFELPVSSPISRDEGDWLQYVKTEPVFDKADLPELTLDATSDCLSEDGSNYHYNCDNYPHGASLDLSMVNEKLTNFNNQIDQMLTTDIDSLCYETNPETILTTPAPSPLDETAPTKLPIKPLKKVSKRKKAPRKQLTSSQKAAHNIIEKKYRININTKIENLQKLIPSVATESAGFRTSSSGASNQVKSNKLNKSSILDKAIEYIIYLQNNQKE